MALYDDGRIGYAADVALAVAEVLADVTNAVTIPDADKASGLAGSLANVIANCSLATSIEDIASVVSDAIGLAREIARASSDPDVASPVWKDAAIRCAALQNASASPAVRRAAALADAIAGVGEAACLGEYAIALSQGSFTDRQSALVAKQALTNNVGDALERVAATAGEEVWAAVSSAIEMAAGYLVDRSLDLRPVVRITAPMSLPATGAAWALYGDPQRADDLLDRNRVGTPAFMPISFEALAP
jgi:prophage DNA circulation protein